MARASRAQGGGSHMGGEGAREGAGGARRAGERRGRDGRAGGSSAAPPGSALAGAGDAATPSWAPGDTRGLSEAGGSPGREGAGKPRGGRHCERRLLPGAGAGRNGDGDGTPLPLPQCPRRPRRGRTERGSALPESRAPMGCGRSEGDSGLGPGRKRRVGRKPGPWRLPGVRRGSRELGVGEPEECGVKPAPAESDEEESVPTPGQRADLGTWVSWLGL